MGVGGALVLEVLVVGAAALSLNVGAGKVGRAGDGMAEVAAARRLKLTPRSMGLCILLNNAILVALAKPRCD